MKITFSTLGPSIKTQTTQAKLMPINISFNLIEHIHVNITLARIHEVLTDAEYTRARQRPLKRAMFVEKKE